MRVPKGRVAKAGLIALEIIGVAVAVIAAVAGFLLWRLETGPISLALFADSAEFAIEKALPPGHKAVVADATLAKGADKGAYDLVLQGVEIESAAGAKIADLSRVALTFAASDLFHGAAGPRRILITDPVLRVERGADRRISLAYAPPGAGERNLFQVLTGGKYFREAFQSAELVNAEVHFIDEASKSAWRAEGATASVMRTGEGYSARLEGTFDVDGESASMTLDAFYSEQRGVISADLRFADAPVGDVLSLFYGPDAAVLSAPLTGAASITLAETGAVLSSRIDAHAGAGILTIGNSRAEVAFIDFVAGFDPESDEFSLEKLNYAIGASRGEFQGTAEVSFAEEGLTPRSVSFDLAGTGIVVGGEGFLPEPLPIERMAAKGAYGVAERRLALQALQVEVLGVTLAGSFSLARPRSDDERSVSPEIRSEIKVEGALDRKDVLRAWPMDAAQGAREFVETRMPSGTVENIAVKIDLSADAVGVGRPMPDEALALTFDVKDATAIYSPGMTPLTGASGSGRLSGNRFTMDVPRGRVGKVVLSRGDVEFTALSPRGAPVHFRFTATGAAKDMLSVLNEEPLALLKETDLSPSQFAGDAVARVDITRPNLREAPRESYGYTGTASFEDLTVSEFLAGSDLTGLTGKIDLASRSMRLTATAEFGEAPVTIDWTQRFFAADGRSKFLISGTADSTTADIFGLPTRNLLRGPIAFRAEALGELGKLDELAISADFTDAELLFGAFGWTKPLSDAASGVLDVAFAEDGLDIRAIELEGEGIDIKGAGKLATSGAIDRLSFERFFLEGAADFSLSATRLEGGPLDVALTGPLLDAGPFIESSVESRSADGESKSRNWGRGMFVRARVDELILREGAQYRDAALDFRRGAERLEALEFSARTPDGAPLSMALRETGAESGPKRAVAARTDDIGALFAGVFGVTSIRGGEGSMEILVNPSVDGESQGLTGVIEARGLRVIRAPLLARVFSAGSLTGLADLLNGEGIEISNAVAEFRFHKGSLFVKEARAAGPSVGITASGAVVAGDGGEVSLNGAVAPAYQVNSLLGKAPVIGDLFVNREGEGVLALAYQVSGPPASPTVTVNPLSALTPGFLRRMFEPNLGADAADTSDAAPDPSTEN